MEPITAVTSAVTAGHHLVSLLKAVTESLRASGKSEALQQVIDLQLATLDLIAKQQSLAFENGALQERVRELERQLSLPQSFRFDGTVYWMPGADENKPDGPFCPVCMDKDKKAIRLQSGFEHDPRHPQWFCLACKSGIGGRRSGEDGAFSGWHH